ncbi:phosphatase [Legionella sp. km772]|uniref:phosphatase n=1 Tax=Legionella sp. km772 TaxID=2498111 RepID=UPI000F8CAED1|nr:phosphatase [Legionella sp. km772]RUR08365.1 phosphatase [Legionella sp. km772]
MRLLAMACLLACGSSYADTIDNYMKIATNIPIMEMKADAQAQAWARSARHVLTITCESIGETLVQANEAARQQGRPLFCLANGAQLNSVIMNDLIQQTYKEISSQQSDKDKMTVSQIALLGVSKRYPCKKAKEMAQLKTLMGQ